MPSRSASPKCARGFEVLVVQAGFKARQQRPAAANVVAKLRALAIAEHGNVGQNQRAIFAQCFRVQAVFVDEVEREAAAQQCVVQAVRRVAHVAARAAVAGPG